MKSALSIIQGLSSLMLSTMLLMMGNSLFTTLTALRADIEGYPTWVIGLMTSSYFLGTAVGTLRVGALINRVGHIRSFAAFAAIGAAATLSFLLALNPWAWVLLRLIMGISIAGCFVVTESWLNNRATNQNRGTLLSIYMVIIYLAGTSGQQSLRLGDPINFEMFLFTSILLALAIVPVALTKATHPDPVRKPQIDLKRLVNVSPTALTGCLIGGLITGSMWGLGPVYAQALNFELNQIAAFMSIFVVGGLLFQLPIGRLSDHFDRRKVLLSVTIAATLPSIILSIGMTINSSLLFLSIGCFGGLVSTIYPLSISYANDYLASEDIMSTSAGFVFVFSTGAVIGPIVVSSVMNVLGSSGLFILNTLALLTLAGCILWRMRIRQWVPLSEKEPFVALPEAPAPTIISDLDPRAEVNKEYDLGPDKIDY